MADTGELRPYHLVGPGEILKRNLEALGWSQEDLAGVTDMSTKTVSTIVNNKQRITVETAQRLSAALGPSFDYWLKLDNNYRLRLLDGDGNDNPTRQKAEIRRHMPVLEIQKKGWSAQDSSVDGYRRTFADVWGKQPGDVSVYESAERYCARGSVENETYTADYTLTWLQIAHNFAARFEVSTYDRVKLERLAGGLLSYTTEDTGVADVVADLEVSGVKFLSRATSPKHNLTARASWTPEIR